MKKFNKQIFEILDNKAILIKGITGSLGKALTKTLLARQPDLKRLVIY